MITFSCVIPVKDKDDPLLKDLIDSIKSQEFPQDQIEILVIDGEMCGDPEQAKAMGIRKAKGEICAMFCADNELVDKDIFRKVYERLKNEVLTGYYSSHYAYVSSDNSLNRYFSLIGANDPVAFYLGKADRLPHYKTKDYFNVTTFHESDVPSLGCNGFFYKADRIKQTDLEHYYPMDNAVDLVKIGYGTFWRSYHYLHHKTTDGNLFNFLKRRYKYARDLYCDRTDRRWRMVGNKKDAIRLLYFSLFSISFIQPLLLAARGFQRVRDPAWFWHPIVCFSFTIMYGFLACRNLLKYQSLFQRSTEGRSLNAA